MSIHKLNAMNENSLVNTLHLQLSELKFTGKGIYPKILF